MRVLQKECELNVLAEFKKFDIHKLQRGVVTKDCVKRVFKAELIEIKFPQASLNDEVERRTK